MPITESSRADLIVAGPTSSNERSVMLKWFRKDPIQQLKQEHAKLLVEARDLQRKGDIVAFSDKTAEAEEVLRKIDELEAEQK